MSSTFTAANITAILTEAKKGGTYGDILKRAKVHVNVSTLQGWISVGRKAAREEKITAYRIFYDTWIKVHPGTLMVGEESRMSEMQSALLSLGIVKPQREIKSSEECDCGNPKPRTAISCDTCKQMDANYRTKG